MQLTDRHVAVFYHIEDYKILFPPDNKRLLPPKKDVACPALLRKTLDVIIKMKAKDTIMLILY